MSDLAVTQARGGRARLALLLGVAALLLYVGGGFTVGGVFWLLGPLVGLGAIVLGVTARRSGGGREATAAIVLGAIPVLWTAAFLIVSRSIEMDVESFRPLSAARRGSGRPAVLRRPCPQPQRPEQRDRTRGDVRVLARQPWPASDRRTAGRSSDRVPAALLRSRTETPARGGQRRFRSRVGRLRRRAPCGRHVRLVGMLEAAMTNAAHEGGAAGGLHPQPAPLVRLARLERGLRRAPSRNRPRRPPQPHVSHPTRLGDHRHRCVTPHAGGILRVHPRPAVADRCRSMARSIIDKRCRHRREPGCCSRA